MKSIADQKKPNITIKDKDNKDFNFDTTLQIQVDEAVYQAVWKDFRAITGLPAVNANGQPITWFNGFGAKYSNDRNLNQGDKVAFTVTIRRPPPAPNGIARKICYYDSTLPGSDNRTKVVDVQEEPESNSDVVVFKLTIGDPPTGIYP